MVDKIAERISEDEYLEKYAERHYEWVDGEVIPLSPATMRHYLLVKFLTMLLDWYFVHNPVGITLGEPYMLKLSDEGPRREPDVLVLLHSNPARRTETTLFGAPDVCIEVVSEGTADTDYGKKMLEYEKGGVREYWLVDAGRRVALFFRLDEDGRYASANPDGGMYRTPLLPKFALPVDALWQETLPNPQQTLDMVRAMWAGE